MTAKVMVTKSMPSTSVFAGAPVSDLPTGYICHLIESGRMLDHWEGFLPELKRRMDFNNKKLDPWPKYETIQTHEWFANTGLADRAKLESMLKNEVKEWNPKYQPRTKENLLVRIDKCINLLSKHFPDTAAKEQDLFSQFFGEE